MKIFKKKTLWLEAMHATIQRKKKYIYIMFENDRVQGNRVVHIKWIKAKKSCVRETM